MPLPLSAIISCLSIVSICTSPMPLQLSMAFFIIFTSTCSNIALSMFAVIGVVDNCDFIFTFVPMHIAS